MSDDNIITVITWIVQGGFRTGFHNVGNCKPPSNFLVLRSVLLRCPRLFSFSSSWSYNSSSPWHHPSQSGGLVGFRSVADSEVPTHTFDCLGATIWP